MASADPKVVLDAATRAFLDSHMAVGLPPVQDLSPADARRALRSVQSGHGAGLPVAIEDRVFPVGPKCSVGVRILRPAGVGEALPVILYFRGGGWIMGDAQTYDRLLRALVTGTGAAVAFVDYTPVPEARFPVQIEEAYAALDHIAGHGADFNLDAGRIALCGDSAGGNMAAAVSLLAKRRHGPRIALQVLFYPVTADIADDGSYAQFRDGPWLTRAAMEHFLGQYLPDAAARREVTAFPLTASREQLAGLPPALIIVAENDVLRDEGEAYARKLIEAGVDAVSIRFNGTIHDFVLMDGLAATSPARAAVAQTVAAFRNAFGTP